MTGSNPKILIIEDETALLKAVATKLRLDGFDPSSAATGTEGLEMLKKDKFDAIVLDLMLPDIDGFEILQRLKELKIETPVLVVSALSQTEDRKRAIDLGAKDYFYKGDISLSDLENRIKDLIANNKQL